ncbi:MAG TPA: hypothetical protein VIP52_13525 [Candidatus Dormibacteraeota bacterium]
MADDPELERKLEAMFSSARPRHGFSDELWRRIEARRPWHQRFGRRFQPALRYAPALALLLVVGLGVTWLAGNFHGAGSTASPTSAGAPAFGDSKAAAPAFGVLPSLAPGAARSVTSPQFPLTSGAAGAGLTFGGTLPSLPSELPVYRYDEPGAADLVAAAATLQGKAGLALTVMPSDPATGVEPQFSTAAGSAPDRTQGAAATANGFLSNHNLAPRFAFQLTVAPSGLRVVYGRLFDGPAGPIRQVRPDGSAAGLTVDLVDSVTSTASARGPLDLPFTSASYPLRTAAAALTAAKLGQASGTAGLNRAELVYVLVVSGGHGYYEPELLLTGPGGAVLAPVVAEQWLGG